MRSSVKYYCCWHALLYSLVLHAGVLPGRGLLAAREPVEPCCRVESSVSHLCCWSWSTRCPALVVTSDSVIIQINSGRLTPVRWACPCPQSRGKCSLFSPGFPSPTFQTNLSGSAFSPLELSLMSLFCLGKMQMPKPFFLNPELHTLDLSVAIAFISMKMMNAAHWEKMPCTTNPHIMQARLKTVDSALCKPGKNSEIFPKAEVRISWSHWALLTEAFSCSISEDINLSPKKTILSNATGG